MPRSSDRTIETPLGPARAVVAPARAARLTLVLGHGASGGIQARDLAALAAALPGGGVSVVRVEQPWKVADRKVAAPPAQLDRAWCAVLESLAAAGVLAGPIVVGGRSAGARVACRTAVPTGAAGCLALAFPLHPPGRPERSRLDELLGAGVPTLVVQGERDSFGTPGEFPGEVELVAVPHADHGLQVPRSAPLSQAEALGLVVGAARSWLRSLPVRSSP
jgi:predicted alpha/beta-hydrolase family hydrolase